MKKFVNQLDIDRRARRHRLALWCVAAIATTVAACVVLHVRADRLTLDALARAQRRADVAEDQLRQMLASGDSGVLLARVGSMGAGTIRWVPEARK